MNRRTFLKRCSWLGALPFVSLPAISETQEEAQEPKHDYLKYKGVWCEYSTYSDKRLDLHHCPYHHYITFSYKGAPYHWGDITDSKNFPDIPFKTKRF